MERLPRDAMIDIISRLPIKSVLRCKSVSKSLEAHLSDPFFAAAHFNRASTLTPFSDYIIGEDNKLPYFIEIEETSTISKPKHLNFPFVTDCLMEFTRPILMGSCLGYVCLSARDMYWGGAPCPTNPMYLFNPITGANVLLPQFEATRSTTCLYGFGLDISSQKCKVVLVYVYTKTFSVQVHTVGRDYSWRTNTVPTMLTDVTEDELAKDKLQTTLPLELNGSIHWIVLSLVDKWNVFGARRACILSFQLDTEVFRVIPMPGPLQVINPYFYNSMKYALQVCGGCLSIIYSPEESFVDMWVMTDYNTSQSWVKTYSIYLNCLRISQIRPIGFRKNGELMLHLDNEGLVSYNTDSDRYTILKSCWTMPFPFVGSLISLKSAYGDSKPILTASNVMGYATKASSVTPLQNLNHIQSQRMLPEASSMSIHSTSQTGYANSADWQEEVYQKIKTMKEMYYPDLDEMYVKVCCDSIVELPKEQRERMKDFLKPFISFLHVSKSNIPLSYKDKMDSYEKQIATFLNSHWSKKSFPSDQGQQQLQPSQTGHTNSTDWQEEVYQKIKTMKEMYYPDLDEMYMKVCRKVEHDSIAELPKEQRERLNMMKGLLKRYISFLHVSKSNIPLSYKDKMDRYEKQITTFLNSLRGKKPFPSDQGQQQLQPSQTGHTNSADWQEEVYQKNKAMKEMYYPDLDEMYVKVCRKVEHDYCRASKRIKKEA